MLWPDGRCDLSLTKKWLNLMTQMFSTLPSRVSSRDFCAGLYFFFHKYNGSKQITYIVFSSLFINVFIVWAKAGMLGLSLTRPASLPLSHLICVSWRVLSIKTIYCKLVVNNVKWSFSEHKTPTVRPAPHTAR